MDVQDLSADDIRNEVLRKLADSGVTYEARFVPQSLSRNRQEKTRTLNWFADFKRAGKPIMSVEFMQGIGHILGYHAMPRNTNDTRAAEYEASEKGVYAPRRYSDMAKRLPGPHAADVLHSIVLDHSAADQSFEDWAADYGYNADSRSAEATYYACVKQSRKARAFFGPALLAEFATILQDY